MPTHWTTIHSRFPELCEGVKRKGHPHKRHCNSVIGWGGMCNRSLEQAEEDIKKIKKGGSPWIGSRQQKKAS